MDQMRKAILLLLLAAVSGSASAAWVSFGQNNTSTVYYDPTTIRRTDDIVTMWALFDLKKPRMIDILPYLSSKVQYEYDCKKGSVRMLSSDLRSGNMGDGDLVYAVDIPGDWAPIAPDSVNEGLRKFACGK